MPLTIRKPEGFDDLSPENDSVFDSLYTTLMKKAARLSGMDTPEGQLMMALNPTPLVAGVPPDQIPALKEAGKAMLERVKEKGLEKRSLGSRPMTREGLERTKGLAENATEADYHRNIPLPEDIYKALAWAQQRYPRIFGHIKDIHDIDALTQLTSGGLTRGSQTAEVKYVGGKDPFKPTKFSTLGFNVIDPPPLRADAAVVGHELLHATDNIVSPEKLRAGYKASNALPGGYDANAYEARASVQGERFARKMAGEPVPKPVSVLRLEDVPRYQMGPAPPPAPPPPLEATILERLMTKLGLK